MTTAEGDTVAPVTPVAADQVQLPSVPVEHMEVVRLHQQLDHMHLAGIQEMARRSLRQTAGLSAKAKVYMLDLATFKCTGCVPAKMVRRQLKDRTSGVRDLNQRVHSDTMTVSVPSVSGNRTCQCFVEDRSRFTILFFSRHKDATRKYLYPYSVHRRTWVLPVIRH